MSKTYKINAYVYRRRFLFIGWLTVYKPEEPILYSDDCKTITVSNEYELPYMTVGFTERGVIRKLTNYIERYPYAINNTEETT